MKKKNNYVYLLREREFRKTNEDIYKIGKTTQDGLKRFNSYPNGSELILHVKVNDCHSCEKNIIDIFKKEFKQVKNIGNEYFRGNVEKMMKMF